MLSALGKPVILTGSQASIFALHSDAVSNLLGALIVAGTFVIPEVGLFFHHTLFRGNRTTKLSASSFAAFDSPNLKPLAVVTGMGIDVDWSLVRRPTALERFSVRYALETAHVACLRVFPGITAALLDSVLKVEGLKGLILETFGSGNAPAGEDGSITAVLAAAVKRGIVVVNVSQCPSGAVSPVYAPATVLGNAGVVFGHDLTTEAALTKLFFLLGLPGLSYKEIVERMCISLRGEMTEAAAHPQFAHVDATQPGSSLSDEQRLFTELGYCISSGDAPAVVRMLDDSGYSLLNAVDYAGNTALHLAAVGSSVEIIKELLTRGASVHVRNKANNTPLWMAERVGNDEIVAVLKQTGALLNVVEKGGVVTPVGERRGSLGIGAALEMVRSRSWDGSGERR
jgi:lysophospholipase